MSGANSTAPEAHSVHGTNPQFLVERITRDKIYAMTYWKEKCFGVSAAALVDLAMGIREFGGVYGGTQRCTDFICLLLKMLQIQPDKEIVVRLPGRRAARSARSGHARRWSSSRTRSTSTCACSAPFTCAWSASRWRCTNTWRRVCKAERAPRCRAAR